MQGHPHPGEAATDHAQGAGQDFHRGGRKVTHVEFHRSSDAGTRFRHRHRRAREDVGGFAEENLSGRCQAHGLAGALQQVETEFVLQIADLAADGRLRNTELGSRARDVLPLRHGDEVAQVAQFHAPEHNQML